MPLLESAIFKEGTCFVTTHIFCASRDSPRNLDFLKDCAFSTKENLRGLGLCGKIKS